jgi:hypothetical protein
VDKRRPNEPQQNKKVFKVRTQDHLIQRQTKIVKSSLLLQWFGRRGATPDVASVSQPREFPPLDGDNDGDNDFVSVVEGIGKGGKKKEERLVSTLV